MVWARLAIDDDVTRPGWVFLSRCAVDRVHSSLRSPHFLRAPKKIRSMVLRSHQSAPVPARSPAAGRARWQRRERSVRIRSSLAPLQRCSRDRGVPSPRVVLARGVLGRQSMRSRSSETVRAAEGGRLCAVGHHAMTVRFGENLLMALQQASLTSTSPSTSSMNAPFSGESILLAKMR